MEKVLVVGANGLTGTKIVDILKNHGQYDPIAMIRDEDQKEKFDDMGVEIRLADLEGDLSVAVEGIDKIIFTAGSGSKTGPEKTTEVDEVGAKRLIDEAEKVKLKKFVMLSAMGADNPESHEKLERYLTAKHKADEHLKNSQLNYTIVRAGGLTNEEHKGHIEAAEKLDRQGEISREDIAQVLISCLDHANVKNRTLEVINGSQNISAALGSLR